MHPRPLILRMSSADSFTVAADSRPGDGGRLNFGQIWIRQYPPEPTGGSFGLWELMMRKRPYLWFLAALAALSIPLASGRPAANRAEAAEGDRDETLRLTARSRVKDAEGAYHVRMRTVEWKATPATS